MLLRAQKFATVFGSGDEPTPLPTSGPYAGLGALLAPDYPNLTLGTEQVESYANAPLIANELTINGEVTGITHRGIYLLANKVYFGSAGNLNASGETGGYGEIIANGGSYDYFGGDGGSGGSGGGGGQAISVEDWGRGVYAEISNAGLSTSSETELTFSYPSWTEFIFQTYDGSYYDGIALGGSYYFELFDPSGNHTYFWLTVDGAGGTDPMISGATGYQVNFENTYTAEDCANQLASVLTSAGYNVSSVAGDGTITFYPTVFGEASWNLAGFDYNVADIPTIGVAPVAGEYITFYSKNLGVEESFCYWFSVDGEGSAPGLFDHETEVVLFGNESVETIVDSLNAVIDSTLFYTFDYGTSIEVINRYPGASSASITTVSNAALSLSFSTGEDTSLLPGDYVTVTVGASDYYFWLNVDSLGVDPALPGTGIEVNVAAFSSQDVIAQDFASAVEASADFIGGFSGNVTSILSEARETGSVNTGGIGFVTDNFIDGIVPYVTASTAYAGGSGGSGVDGDDCTDGLPRSDFTFLGEGGTGYAALANPESYAFPNGGDGGAAVGSPASGGPGYGGGGEGDSYTLSQDETQAGYGGGGGAHTVCVFANEPGGAIPPSATIIANGGYPRGGGGSILLGFKKWNGETFIVQAVGDPPGADGTVVLLELANDGSIVGPRNFTDIWDNT